MASASAEWATERSAPMAPDRSKTVLVAVPMILMIVQSLIEQFKHIEIVLDISLSVKRKSFAILFRLGAARRGERLRRNGCRRMGWTVAIIGWLTCHHVHDQ